MIRPITKEGMHRRNRFRGGYDFGALVAQSPALEAFVKFNPYGDASIDYANPHAVKALNQALMLQAYGLRWDIPPRYLCPPIPGRSDAIHHLADLLVEGSCAALPHGPSVRVLDVGMGASAIYPLVGASEYGWRFAGSEADSVALRWARKLVSSNPSVKDLIDCRWQPSPDSIFKNVIQPGEAFDLSMCNPPFHASASEARAGATRKRRNLGTANADSSALLNFGGQAAELWCQGGEVGFVRRMIVESVRFKEQCRWFTTLVSKGEHLPRLHHALREVAPREVKTIKMAQGQKQSRILAWTFQQARAKASARPARSRD